MSLDLQIHVTKLQHFLSLIHKQEREMKRDLGTMLLAGAYLVERHAKQRLVPGRGRRTGALASSIRVTPTQPAARIRVGPTQFYGAFVEFGTGRAGARSGIQPWGGYTYGSRGGMKGQAYLKTGLRQATPAINKELHKLGLSIVHELAK